MNRRNFIAALVSTMIFVETAKAYVDPPGWHRHQCPKCGFIWTHTGGPGSTHNCTKCGGFQNVWYQGPLAPSNIQQVPPMAPAPAVTKPTAPAPAVPKPVEKTLDYKF